MLADTVAASAWVERWQALDPDNPDAAPLRAQVEVVRAVRARSQIRDTGTTKTLDEVEELCRRAASRAEGPGAVDQPDHAGARSGCQPRRAVDALARVRQRTRGAGTAITRR